VVVINTVSWHEATPVATGDLIAAADRVGLEHSIHPE